MNMIGNLFKLDFEPQTGAEQRATVGSQVGLAITRAVSVGYATPPGTWYEGCKDGVMVMILSGEAGVLVTGEHMPHILVDGDYLLVPGHKGYRIEWTHPSNPTVWLAVQRSMGRGACPDTDGDDGPEGNGGRSGRLVRTNCLN